METKKEIQTVQKLDRETSQGEGNERTPQTEAPPRFMIGTRPSNLTAEFISSSPLSFPMDARVSLSYFSTFLVNIVQLSVLPVFKFHRFLPNLWT